MPMLRPLLAASLSALASLALLLQLSSCTTDSEAPNAGYAAGPTPGTENNRCRSDNSCLDEDAHVCIVSNDGDTTTCRRRCDRNAATSECDATFACAGLENSQDEGACIPIGGLGEECGVCDTDLTCVGDICLQDCEVVDGGSGCAADEACASVDGGPTVCVD
jgi:hypothetical protein